MAREAGVKYTFSDMLNLYLGGARLTRWERFKRFVLFTVRGSGYRERVLQEELKQAKARARTLLAETMLQGSFLSKIKKDDTWRGGTFQVPFRRPEDDS
jgi:hypothetical protein